MASSVSEPIIQMQITLFWGAVPCGLIKRKLLDQFSGSWTLKEFPPLGRIIPTRLCRFTAMAVGTSNIKGKDKGKFHRISGHDGPEGIRGCCTLSLTTSLDWGGCSTPRPGRLNPWKETGYPLYWRLGRPKGRSERVRKISLPPGFDPRTFQAAAILYTGYSIPAHELQTKVYKNTLLEKNTG
jgi:hypothetical protein